MARIEVLGVEVRSYRGEGFQALVPRIIGQTERALQEKARPASRRKITESEFLASCPPLVADFFAEVLAAGREKGFVVRWRLKSFSLRPPRLSGDLVSALYDYLAGSYGSQVPLLEVFFGSPEPEENTARCVGPSTGH